MDEKNTKDPLLYIDQPTFTVSKPFMQESYSSLIKRKETNISSSVSEQPKRVRRQRVNPFFDVFEEVEEEEEEFYIELDDEEKLEHTEEQQDDVKFNDLSIQGKIDYFLSLPKEMPRMKSEIKLKNDVYRGFIVKDNGDDIVIQTARMYETIKKDDITDIILLGF